MNGDTRYIGDTWYWLVKELWIIDDRWIDYFNLGNLWIFMFGFQCSYCHKPDIYWRGPLTYTCMWEGLIYKLSATLLSWILCYASDKNVVWVIQYRPWLYVFISSIVSLSISPWMQGSISELIRDLEFIFIEKHEDIILQTLTIFWFWFRDAIWSLQ